MLLTTHFAAQVSRSLLYILHVLPAYLVLIAIAKRPPLIAAEWKVALFVSRGATTAAARGKHEQAYSRLLRAPGSDGPQITSPNKTAFSARQAAMAPASIA